MNDRSIQEEYDELVRLIWMLIDDSVGRLADQVLKIFYDLIRSIRFEKQLEESTVKSADDKKARAEDESVERAQQQEDQVTYNSQAKATIKHHCKPYYSTSRKASHRPRNRI